MRYMICGMGWPVGSWLIPTGSVIDDVSGTDTWSTVVRERGLIPPPNSTALDEETRSQMAQLYGGR
ncbi:MAG: hypothetical protein WAV38_25345 [Xanthobacteraceae bacterium]